MKIFNLDKEIYSKINFHDSSIHKIELCNEMFAAVYKIYIDLVQVETENRLSIKPSALKFFDVLSVKIDISRTLNRTCSSPYFVKDIIVEELNDRNIYMIILEDEGFIEITALKAEVCYSENNYVRTDGIMYLYYNERIDDESNALNNW